MSKEKLNLIVRTIKRISKETGINSSDVTKTDIFHTEDSITEWDLRSMGGLDSIKKKYFPVTNKNLAIIKDNKDTASYISKLEKEVGTKLLNEEKIKEIFSQLKVVNVRKYKSIKKKQIKRAINVMFSDLHIGSDIKSEETGRLDFGKVQESRRLAKITREVIEYKSQYRDETELNLILLGDIIQSSLHDARDAAPLAEQCCRAIHLLSQSIGLLASNFRKVNVYCNSGNHGRNLGRHHNRAVNQKWDSYETVIYYALKNAFKDIKTIEFHIPLTPYVTYQSFSKKLFFTHGDTVLNPGYPGKSINNANLEKQINKINASLPDSEEYSVFGVGHVHTGSISHLANGAVMITNGAMVPSDEYAVSIGLMENSCGQYIFESVEGYPLGDCRFIKVDEKDDKDSSLDKIITPFNNI